MADRTASGKAVDKPAMRIRLLRMGHEIHGMEVSVERYEIDILEMEQNAIRLGETIKGMKKRIIERRDELEKLQELTNG